MQNVRINSKSGRGMQDYLLSRLNKRTIQNYIEVFKVKLPELILEYFDLVNTKIEEEKMHLYIEEKSKAPKEYNKRQLI